MVIKSKKGLIRAIEATISVLLVFSVILIIASRTNYPSGIDLRDKISPILEEIAREESYRTKVLEYDLTKDESDNYNKEIITLITNFTNIRIENPRIVVRIKICDIEESCALDNYALVYGENEVFSDSRIITTYVDQAGYSPRKIKLFAGFGRK